VDDRRRLQGLAVAATVLDLAGARVAVGHGMVGEPFRIRFPSSAPAPVVLVAWGTAVSAPWWMDAALGAAVAGGDIERARRAARVLGGMRLVGVLAEPMTWGRRRPRGAMALSAAHLALAGALVASGRPWSSAPSRRG
jgi:hypothetical protein